MLFNSSISIAEDSGPAFGPGMKHFTSSICLVRM